MSSTKILTSRAARVHFRELLDHILRGDIVVITRHGEWVAAVIPFELWQQLSPDVPTTPPTPPA